MSNETNEITADRQPASGALPLGQPVLSSNIVFGEHSYYRSKLFNTHVGVNPLAAAASPLLTLAGQIETTASSPDIGHLHQHLQHEIKAFEHNAQNQGYRSETILIARYLLCTLVDDLLAHSGWKGKDINTPEVPSLLVCFHQENNGGERFFVILERLSADPALHIDLLELAYLCLSAGFTGQYATLPNGREMLEQITARLYEGIRIHRGELKKELAVLPAAAEKPPPARMQWPVWLITCFTLAVLLTIYSSFSYMLGNNAEALYQQMMPLWQNISHS